MSRTIAALDLGSNSFHLAFAEQHGGRSFALATASKEKVQLGRSVFETGVVDAEGFARGLAAVRRLRRLIDLERPEVVLAVATSALREALNGGEFVRQAAAISGFPIRVISGDEEARLVCAGVLRSEDLDAQRTAIVDLGGGSTEVVVADDGGCRLATSLPLGTLRLRSEWPCTEPPSIRDLELLAERVRGILEPALRRVDALAVAQVVLSCGSARRLARLSRALLPELGLGAQEQLTRETLIALRARLASLPPEGRAALIGDDPARADTLLVASIVFEVLFERMAIRRAAVSSAGLREGLVVDYLAQRERLAAKEHALAV